jgi:AhpD family alkylhydroperoxidase
MTAHEFQQYASGANAGLMSVGKSLAASGLEHELLELIKLRASQINGCAYCTQLHLNDSRRLGISAAKLDLIVVWREAGIFSEREKAALAWTELLTKLAVSHVTDEDYAAVSAQFAPQELAWLSTSIALINAWNRLAAPFQYAPPIPHEAQAAKAPEPEPAHV